MRIIAEEEDVSSTVKFVIGGLVVVVVIVAVIASGIGGSTSDYLTVAEIKSLGSDQTRKSRVSGEIFPNTDYWKTREINMTIEYDD